jgi:phosphoadenosine phosphosulfate reductase
MHSRLLDQNTRYLNNQRSEIMTIDPAVALHARYGVAVADASDLGAAELELLAQEAGRGLAEARAIDILTWTSLTFGPRFVVTSSMADGVVAHLASRAHPGVNVLFLDTGLHFAETLGTREALVATLDINLINATPDLTVEQQNQKFGPLLWADDPDRCCEMRKVVVLERELAPFQAWVTGIRGDETADRVGTPVVHWDSRRGMVKVNPIARWTQAEVEAYAERHGVLVNPLRQIGFQSIGCAPCTRPVRAGENARAGRWAGRDKAECGIHG